MIFFCFPGNFSLLFKKKKQGDQEKYLTIQNSISILIEHYQLLKSGKLTTNELKKLKFEIIDTIDIGNK